MSEDKSNTNWHVLLARLLQLILEHLNVQVLSDVQLLTDPPKADILLIRRESSEWTEEQRRWLADGLRHTDAGHLLIEFKYTESLTFSALRQLMAYDYFYCEVGKRSLEDVACFLIVAKTPQGDWCNKFGFTATEWPGVYQGSEIFTKRIKILLLNELESTPHNAALKCFATKRKERDAAFATMSSSGLESLSFSIEKLVNGLRRIFMSHTLQVDELTPDRVMELGQELMDAVLKYAPLEKILSYHKPDEILSHYQPNTILNHYKPEQRLAGLTEEQIRAYLEKIKKS
ncbi:hypothetical protein TI03_04495 [Achromatium sp. WMS1]|nr:hypothetical protein TI03_04495 [Achromatium sp. WMS1]